MNQLSDDEEKELEVLTDHKLSKTRFMSQPEQDRYKVLMKKKFGNMAIGFELLQTFKK